MRYEYNTLSPQEYRDYSDALRAQLKTWDPGNRITDLMKENLEPNNNNTNSDTLTRAQNANFNNFTRAVSADVHREFHIENPVKGILLGKGNAGGEVFVHAQDPTLAIKCGDHGLKKEFETGSSLDSPYIVKFHKLHALNDDKYQIVMDKIQEQACVKFCRGTDKLPDAHVLQILSDVKKVIEDLFENNIFWADVNGENIFFSEDGHLKICDLGCWDKEEKDSVRKAKRLLIGAMELTGWIIKSSYVRKERIDRELEFSVMYPKEYFKGIPLNFLNIFSMHGSGYYQNDWMMEIESDLKNMSDQEKLAYVLNYIDQVIDKFKTYREIH